MRRKIAELDFLNELQLELKGLTDAESVIEKAISRLEGELEAACGCHCDLRDDVLQIKPNSAELEAVVSGLDLDSIVNPLATETADGRSLCLLPLVFQGTSFGCLVFLFPEQQPFQEDELSFAEAASHIVSSVLYSQYVHRQEMKKEQFLVLGQMASMIVHDLKGPLATILGFVSLLQAEMAAAEREEFAPNGCELVDYV